MQVFFKDLQSSDIANMKMTWTVKKMSYKAIKMLLDSTLFKFYITQALRTSTTHGINAVTVIWLTHV